MKIKVKNKLDKIENQLILFTNSILKYRDLFKQNTSNDSIKSMSN